MADWFKGVGGGGNSSEEFPFHSRRSVVLCRHACVSTSQPLATSVGLDFLRKGANAAEASIAVAAVLAVVEPCSTGLGGDMFCLHYEATTQQVTAVNGSGASPQELTLKGVLEDHPTGYDTFMDSALSVTVPGAARGWEDTLKRYGSGQFTLSQLLEPATVLAEEGFPVAPITAYSWRLGMSQITKWLDDDAIASGNIPLTVDGRRGPQAGEIIKNPDMARVLRDLEALGSQKGFYEGLPGRAIVEVLQKHGGCLSLADLAEHTSLFPEPISAVYRGVRMWQVPPNGQGVASLIALTGLQRLEDEGCIEPLSTVGTADWYHVLLEMMRLGFADARQFVACPSVCDTDHLLDTERIGRRAQKLFDPQQAAIAGYPDASSCTVSFQVVDAAGNAMSFVQSNYMGFGTGIVPQGCGFTLQNRGFGFSLQEGHVNAVASRKRPYHTIIPAILTHAETNELYATLSNMGGFMQPQGHLQLTVGLVAGGLDPQQAVDRPRFCILDGTHDGIAYLEDGVDDEVVKELQKRQHKLHTNVRGFERYIMGRAQIIQRRGSVLWAGSDGRADGCALGF